MYLKPKGVLNLKYAALLQLMRLKMDANQSRGKKLRNLIILYVLYQCQFQSVIV